MADDAALAASSAPAARAASMAGRAPAAGLSIPPSASSPVDASMPETIGGSGVASLVTTAVALVFVLGLAWVLLRLLKRFQHRGLDRSPQADAPQVVHSMALGQRERLTTVRWRGRDYLLGVTPSNVSLIDRHPIDRGPIDGEPPAAALRPGSSDVRNPDARAS
jgi:flagellar protein FliO/FliZ